MEVEPIKLKSCVTIDSGEWPDGKTMKDRCFGLEFDNRGNEPNDYLFASLGGIKEAIRLREWLGHFIKWAEEK